MNAGKQGALHFDAEIEPRRIETDRLVIIDEVHAADKGDARIDHHQLAMQPPQVARIGTASRLTSGR